MTIYQKNSSIESGAQAEALFRKKQYAESLRYFEEALVKEPRNVKYHQKQAFALMHVGRYEQAFAALHQLAKIKPDLSAVWYRAGNLLKKQKLYEWSYRAYEQITDLMTKLDALHFFFELLHQKKQYHMVVGICDEILRISPTYKSRSAVLWTKAECFRFLNRKSECLKAHDQAIQFADEGYKYSAWFLQAESLYAFANYRKALESYDQSLIFWPNYPWALLGKGRCFFKMQDYHQAINWFQQAVQQEPTLANAWYELACSYGMIYHHKPDETLKTEILTSLQKAIQLEKKYKKLAKQEFSFQELTEEFISTL